MQNSELSFEKFSKKYGTEAKCFQKIVKLRFPKGIECDKCWKITPHYKLKKRKAYGCTICLHQTYPLVGTIFEKSRTKLKHWFYAIYHITVTKIGKSAKSLQRELGVTYKTAWRMLMKIRKLMSEDIGLLKGIVEIDETWIGGSDYFKGKKWWSDYRPTKKQIVLGMVERKGRVKTMIIQDVLPPTLLGNIKRYIDSTTWIITDGHYGYRGLPKIGYKHNFVNHTVHFVDSKNPEIHTQTIEGFWGLLKQGIKATYRHVSKKYLQFYLNEFTFRYNHRKEQNQLIDLILKQT